MASRKGNPVDGILLLDKPLGISSNKALQTAKRLFNARKAGHTGSLDPLASGVLPICFGEATKVSAFLLDSDKSYTTTAQLGETRDTGDLEGNVLQTRDVPALSTETIEAVLSDFRGPIQQIPPMYSALKHQGQPLYKLARQGKTIERKARDVTIHGLTLTAVTEDTLTLDVRCSKGTYIRTLVEDIGEQLGCGAFVKMLRRTEVAPFNNQPCYTLEDLEALNEAQLSDILLPMDVALQHCPAVMLNAEQSEQLLHGKKLPLTDIPDSDTIRLYDHDDRFLGIGKKHPTSGLLAARRLLNTGSI